LALVAAGTGLYLGCKTVGPDLAQTKDVIVDSDAFSRAKLTITADKKTGDVVMRFNATAAGLRSGEQARVAWDVVRSNRDVNCSALRRNQDVTIGARPEATEVKFRVDPKLLADSLAGVPHGDEHKETKYGATNPNTFQGDTVVEGCLFAGNRPIAAGAGLPDTVRPAGLSLDDAEDDSGLSVGLRYGTRCAKAIGYIKPFSCVGDGQTVPITVDGVPQERFVQQCDRPQYLPIGSTQCATNTRVGRPQVFKDKELTQPADNVKAVFFCRHYEDPTNYTTRSGATGKDYPYFHDVAVIMQNTDTGKTCFFQALGGGRAFGEDGEDLYGLRVPPPTESLEEFQANVPAEVRDQGAQQAWREGAAGGFWLSPSNIGQIHCVSCHDSDPFMHSPWIDQVKVLNAAGQPTSELIVPSEPFSEYKIIGAGVETFNAWDTAYSVETPDSKCESCHRIGSMAAIRSWAKDAFPVHEDNAEVAAGTYYDAASKNAWAQAHPNHHWMPPPRNTQSWINSLAGYKTSVKQLRDCYDVRRANNTRILGYGRINQPSGNRLSDADIATLAERGCTVAPISEVVDR
jgi:hypothetical protein